MFVMSLKKSLVKQTFNKQWLEQDHIEKFIFTNDCLINSGSKTFGIVMILSLGNWFMSIDWKSCFLPGLLLDKSLDLELYSMNKSWNLFFKAAEHFKK